MVVSQVPLCLLSPPVSDGKSFKLSYGTKQIVKERLPDFYFSLPQNFDDQSRLYIFLRSSNRRSFIYSLDVLHHIRVYYELTK